MSGSNMSNRSMNDLLIELGTEELPPKALSKLSAAFTGGQVGAVMILRRRAQKAGGVDPVGPCFTA